MLLGQRNSKICIFLLKTGICMNENNKKNWNISENREKRDT